MSYDIQLFINSKIKRYEQIIADEKLYVSSNGNQGVHCLNASDLEKRINWTVDEWMDYMESQYQDLYEIDRINKTYRLKTI